MKRNIVSMMICAALVTASLCSCGNTAVESSSAEKTSGKSAASLMNSQEETPDTASDTSDGSDSAESEGDVEIDLTKIEGTMLYAQVSDMINNPDEYNGKTVRAKGPFNYFKNDAGNEYFAVLISDATACCAQGIEFRLKGDHKYPQDYPDDQAEIVITGICDVYQEGSATYCQLLDAEYEPA